MKMTGGGAFYQLKKEVDVDGKDESVVRHLQTFFPCKWVRKTNWSGALQTGLNQSS
jgi:hypothetical protein